MLINEIFYSLQGEGIWVGLPTIFIRTTGCNLRCSYCDTIYAYDQGDNMKISEMLSTIIKYPCKLVCLTGGEPLLQEDIMTLIDALLSDHYHICVETNGSISLQSFQQPIKSLMFSMDIKCPSSGMASKMNLENLTLLQKKDQVKFVIQTKKDYRYAKDIIEQKNISCPIIFQPVWGSSYPQLAQWIIDDGLSVRFGIQLQKILWGETQGT